MIPKLDNNKNIIWESCYSKIDLKVKYIQAKDFFNEINYKKSLIFNTVYGRRHSYLFINCHVSWDTLYKKVVISVSKIKSELVAITQFLPTNVVNLQNFPKLTMFYILFTHFNIHMTLGA